MPTIYSHEISAYRVELRALRQRWSELSQPNSAENKTHAMLSASNRTNLMVIGLCGLVEARMLELVKDNASQFRLSDIRGQGIHGLKRYLKRTGVIDFSKLSNWDRFASIYIIRNFLVHSYGGLIVDASVEKLQKQVEKLGFKNVLVADRRVRLNPDSLQAVLDVVDKLLEELDAYATSHTAAGRMASRNS